MQMTCRAGAATGNFRSRLGFTKQACAAWLDRKKQEVFLKLLFIKICISLILNQSGGKQSKAVGGVFHVWSDLGREGRVDPRQSPSIRLGPQNQSNQWRRYQFWLVFIVFA